MRLSVTLLAVGLLGAASPALAQYPAPPPYGAPPAYGAAVLPPFEVATIIRSMGFEPIGRPVLRGPVYVVQALDEVSIPVRVLVDARRGNVVRVVENRPGVYAGVYAGVTGPEANFGLRRLPPQTVPPGAVYPPYDDEPMPPGPPTARVPPPPKPKVAVRTPLPRPAPPQSKQAAPPPAVATIPDPTKTPGKSIPAPVAKQSATAGDNNAATDKNDVSVTGSAGATPAQAETPQAPKPPEAKPSDTNPSVTVPPVAPLL